MYISPEDFQKMTQHAVNSYFTAVNQGLKTFETVTKKAVEDMFKNIDTLPKN